MLLAGHQSAIYTLKFNPAGTVIASGSHDREIFRWNVHGDCKNFMVLKGHKNAVLDLGWTTDGLRIISASPDKTVRAWNVETGKQIKKMAEHSSFANSCCPSCRGLPLVWDLRKGEVTMTLQGHQDMITGDGSYVLTNGMDCKLCIWDMRPYAPQNRCVKVLEGHQHNYEKYLLKCSWSPDGSKVTADSSDRMVYKWDTTS
ncbi:U5 small nuclear ribonucleoprotein 40 kDa [Quillaja saponaria]|uniref:U5 small nuclear ribonucleoprotein 40 kDa n=1 Tax=Quillaja saponaria TaxID=32244 RepID=A0AAD7KWP6_QUISA|nr:U5 small nuclear ribonucleoprotein 40 kDa [Quillaja saponaria]